jgi:hypothetical protein
VSKKEQSFVSGGQTQRLDRDWGMPRNWKASKDAQTYPRVMLHAVLHNRADLQFALVQHGVSRGFVQDTSLDEVVLRGRFGCLWGAMG